MFTKIGSRESSGTKLLSISGDCKNPGVYELPFGIQLKKVLIMAGADDAAAVQIGGPSGQMVGAEDFNRTICYDDLGTGGSCIVFGPQRDVLHAAYQFMEFFVEESCGYCTPCRVGNVLIMNRLKKIIDGKGKRADLDYLQKLSMSVKTTSRCGLGQTSPNPVLSTMKNFRSEYEKRVTEADDGLQPSFDIDAALSEARMISERVPVLQSETQR